MKKKTLKNPKEDVEKVNSTMKKSRLNKLLGKTKNILKEFFQVKFNIYLTIFIIFIGLLSFFYTSESGQNIIDDSSFNSTDQIVVHFFYTPTCPYCNQQKPIYFEIKKERPDIQFFEHDASTQKGSEMFYKLSREVNLETSRMGVPTIFVGKNALVGLQSKENIISAIDQCINECKGEEYQTEKVHTPEDKFTDFELPFLGRTDLTKWSFPVLAIILGLVDGFNPCALWVLLFIITLLLGEQDKKKIWIVVGSFVLASAISYFLFMTAWLNLFLLIGYIRIITLIIGLFALAVGILNLKEVLTTKGPLVCKVGDPTSKRKTMDKIKNVLSKPVTLGIIMAIIGLAFMVNAIEFVCSAAIPAVFTQLLALSGMSTLMHYAYITLYVFFYMLDHIIIFGMAAFALGSGMITEKYAKLCKLIGGIIMFILGLIMLFAPHLLR